MSVAPLGSWLTQFDQAMTGAMDTGIVGLCGKMFLPMIGSAAIFYMRKGVDAMKGEIGVFDEILLDTVRIGTAVTVASDPAWFNPIVRDFFFQSVPAYLIGGVMQGMAGAPGLVAAGVNGTAAALDACWYSLFAFCDTIWAKAGMLDVGTKMSVLMCVGTGALALATMALVYLMSRFIMSIVLVLGVIAVALRVIPETRKVFDAWLGKVISLTFLQVALIVTLTIVVSIDQTFMDKIATSAQNGGGVAGDLQTLVSIVILFGLGAFAIWTLPAIAYSLGGGVAMSTMPALYAMYSSVKTGGRLAGAAMDALPALPSFGAGGGGGGLSMGLASAELSAPAMAALPSSGPPALSSYGPLLLR